MTIVVILGKQIYPIQTIQLTLYDWFVVTIPSFYLALESNNTQIKGRFLRDVLVSALPGAILVVLNYVAIIAVKSLFPPEYPLTDAMVSTVTILSTMSVGFAVLYRVCRPFNINRRLLYIAMIGLFVVCLFGVGNLFEIISFSELGFTATLLVIVIALFSVVLYNGSVKLGEKIKDWSSLNSNKF